MGIVLLYQDPVATTDYYLIASTINGQRTSTEPSFVLNDFGINGQEIEEFVFVGDAAQPGDTVRVELRTIEKRIFEYFEQLDQVVEGESDGPGGTAPANPVSNWSNGALGFFAGGSSSFVDIPIEE